MMQHPLMLDLFVEPAAKLRAVVRGESALVIVDVDDTAMRIQRPMGPGGPALFEEELRRGDSGERRRGILAAGLDSVLASRIRELFKTARPPIEQQAEFSNLDQFDLELRGSVYKSLRNSIHHAEREGVSVEPYDVDIHGTRALKVFEEWNSIKPRVATFWIPKILENRKFPDMVSVVAIRRRKVLGVSMAFRAGSYAYMLLAITLRDHGRAQEIMDYELMRKLKAAGVRRLDWGISDSGTISDYKRKYGHIALQPITTFWIPAVP